MIGFSVHQLGNVCGLVSLFVESIYYHCHCESLEVNCVKEKLPIVLCKYFKRPNNYYTKSRTNVNISSIWTVVLIISCFSTPNLSVKHRFMSFCEIHSINKRALQSRILLFKHAVTLHRLVNNEIPSFEWLALHFNIILTSRMVNFKVIPQFNYKVGQNILTNRFSVINGQIPLNWLNKSYASFKLLCKKEFL